MPHPPKIFLRFFRWFCHPELLKHIEGDLMELYNEREKESGKRTADVRFIADVLLLFRPGIIRNYEGYESINSIGMYKNYFKTALRNLWKNRGYSAINIMGLAVGMAVTLLIGLWVQRQLSFDDFHEHKDNIAIVMKKTFFNNTKGTQSGIMLPLFDELKSNYPEVKHITRLDWGSSHSLIIGDKKIMKFGHFADPDFLRMFSFKMVKGTVEKALNDPYSIVLSESLAIALFGEEDPMGKMITVDKSKNVTVTGIVKDPPPNSSIGFDFLMPYELNVLTSDFVKNAKDQWQNNFLQNFVELNEGVSMESFSKRIENIVREKTGEKNESLLFVHAMSKWHLYGEFKDWVNTGGDIEYVRLFSIIGLFVLAIACINFINLSTARSEKRAKEVCIRKTMGSLRKQLIVQFFGESLVTTIIAFAIAVFIVQLSLPLFENIGFKDISLELKNFSLWGYALAGCIITGICAGLYPALYLSAFAPIKVLKGTSRSGKAGDLPRKILVVSQFSFSIALIIGTTVVFQQIQHAKNRQLGYNPDRLISVSLTEDLKNHYDVLKQELLATGYVEAVSKSSSPLTAVWNQWDAFSWEGMDADSKPLFSAIMVDYDYDKVSGIKISEGRFFSREFATDSSAVLINKAAADMIGFKNPLESTIKFNTETMNIIGVTEDVVMQSPFKPVVPAIILLRNYQMAQGLVRIKHDADLQSAMAAIQPVFERHNPSFPFDYKFTDEVFKGKFRNEDQIGKLAGVFAILSIFISCLGLFGLASYMAERRTKEIGIRKVVGASLFSIWKMLSRDFVILVAISCCIAIPLAVYFLSGWLGKYEYRTELSWWIFAASAMSALAITLLTVSFQTVRAARMNPVNSLRSE
jgi:putative ABC transport system permease protein